MTRAEPHVMGEAAPHHPQRAAPDLVPMASLLADVMQVEVAPSPESDRIDPQFRADRTADLVVDLLGRLVPGPLVVVVEEAHWADGASVALLNRLAFATEGRPWAVVVVRRGETGGFAPASGVRVDLEPLPRDVIEHLVHAATEATPLRPHEVAAIVERAEGNPLFVEEVTRLAVGSGSLTQLPESVHAAMSTQIDQLHPRVRRILRYCAVLGRSFRREVLQRILASDDIALDAAMLTALSAFIEPDDETGSASATAWSVTRRTRAWPFGCGHIHRLAGEVLEASAPTATPTRPRSPCTSNERATPPAPGGTPRWPETSRSAPTPTPTPHATSRTPSR